jgi:hypothetical protein
MAAIAVDFDGVIHAYSRGWDDGSIYDEPLAGAFAALRQLMTRYAVFILTTREAESVAGWLRDRGDFAVTTRAPRQFWNKRGVLLVTNRKLPATVYIDDRALRFVDWDRAMVEVRALEVTP